MKSRKIIATLLTFALTASVFVGCGKTKTETGTAKSTEVVLDKEQILNYSLGADVRTMDVSKNFEELGGIFISSTNETLTRKTMDDKGVMSTVPGGAESWKMSEDGLTWTFKIREMNWSDGKPVTAKDYEYSLKRTIDPKTAASYAGMFEMIKGANAASAGKGSLADVAIKALDDRTLEIKLDRVVPYFLGLTSFYTFAAQRQDIVEKFGDKNGTELDSSISCGPFVLKEWTHNSKLVVVKNDKYWDAKNVKLQQINFPVIEDSNAAATQLNNGEVDIQAVGLPEWVAKLKTNQNFNSEQIATPSIGFMILNQDMVVNNVKLFSNKKIRQAMSLAFNREDYVATIANGQGIPAYGFIPPSIHIGDQLFRKFVNNEPLKKVKDANPDIKKLVVDGLKELNADTDPSKYTISYMFGNSSAEAKKNGEYYQQVVEKATGFKLKLEFVESKVKTQRFKKKDYHMTATAWGADYDDPNTFMDLFISTNDTYPTGWKNTDYDKLIKDASTEKDNKKRADLFKQAEDILVGDAVVIANYYNVQIDFINKGVKGYVNTHIGGGIDFKNTYISGKLK